MKTSLTLSPSASELLSDDADRFIAMLGMKRQKFADYAQTIAVVNSHNHPSGRHLLDVGKKGFRAFRRAYGSSLGWILGDYSTKRAIEVISKSAGAALRAFFRGDPNSGVIVLKRLPDEHGMLLHHRELCGNPTYLLDEESTLLLPTDITSPRLGGKKLYERLDLGVSHDHRAPFSIREVLFTGEDGESIAGIGDTGSMFIEHLRVLLPALYRVLREEYNLLDINARMFSAIQRHDLYEPDSDEILVPIKDSEDSTTSVSVLLSRTSGNAWRVHIASGNWTLPLEKVATKRRFAIKAADVKNSQRRLVAAFRSLSNLDGSIDFDAVFAERHLDRLPAEFRAEFARAPELAMEKFAARANESLQRFKKDPSHWKLIHFSAGREKDLELVGESTDTSIQLCAPLYLTAEDERAKRASVFAVVELRSDPSTGKEECKIPSILDHRMAIGDINHLRQGVLQNFFFAA